MAAMYAGDYDRSFSPVTKGPVYYKDAAEMLKKELKIPVEIGNFPEENGYLFVHEPDGVALRFFWYPYPLVEPLETVAGLPVASLLDLVLMKLGALISRGHRRDNLVQVGPQVGPARVAGRGCAGGRGAAGRRRAAGVVPGLTTFVLRRTVA